MRLWCFRPYQLTTKAYLICPTNSLTFPNRGIQLDTAEFCEFHGLVSPLFTFKNSNNSFWKTCKICEYKLWNNDLRESICRYYWIWPKKVKNDPKFVREARSSHLITRLPCSYRSELQLWQCNMHQIINQHVLPDKFTPKACSQLPIHVNIKMDVVHQCSISLQRFIHRL